MNTTKQIEGDNKRKELNETQKCKEKTKELSKRFCTFSQAANELTEKCMEHQHETIVRLIRNKSLTIIVKKKKNTKYTI